MSSIHIESPRPEPPTAVLLMYADGSFAAVAPGLNPAILASTLVDVAFTLSSGQVTVQDVNGHHGADPFDVERDGL